jgi:hypothetical protein
VAGAPVAIPVAAGDRPSGVRLAAVLLLISCLISLMSLASLLMMPNLFSRGFVLIRSVGIWGLWVVLTVLIWQRQGWARFAILLLLAWAIGNMAITGMRIHGVLFALAFPLLMAGLRAGAAFLLFQPESSAWFKK